jgi:hypothetical protein
MEGSKMKLEETSLVVVVVLNVALSVLTVMLQA